MKKNLILNGTGNDGRRHRYSFEKNEKFKAGYLDLLRKLGLNEDEIKKIEERFTRTFYEDDEDETTINLKVLDISDECWYYRNSKYEIDTFFGHKKIILLIRIKSKEKRKKLIECIKKESGWISEEEIEERKEKIKSRNFRLK